MINYALLPFSAVYYTGFLVKKRLTRPQNLQKPVISVGNITWGGAGKTPTVMKLAEDLKKLGRKPVILSRGYRRKIAKGKRKIQGKLQKGKENKILVVTDGENIFTSPDEAGDEPCMIAEKVKKVPVVVGKKRYQAGLFAEKKFNPDIFILDDGFQHWVLNRDLDIVCVNAANPFGNGMLIPAGILREPLSALLRAGLILITNCNLVSEKTVEDLKLKIAEFTHAPIILSEIFFNGVREIISDAPSQVKGEIIAVSGIASNELFMRSLELSGLTVNKFFGFRDHHRYSQHELDCMLNRYSESKFITTFKDTVKLRKLKIPSERFYYLETELKIIEGEKIWQEKIKRLF